MSVDVWEPGKSEAKKTVDAALLGRFLDLATTCGENIADLKLETTDLEAADLAEANWVMTADPSAWSLAADLDTAQIHALIRFFTLLEVQVAGWDAGKTSPVIAMVAVVKARGEFPAELRKWIKANTENRFLPYGSAL